jgi:hypothetical protein
MAVALDSSKMRFVLREETPLSGIENKVDINLKLEL